jgi:hypothetical protein
MEPMVLVTYATRYGSTEDVALALQFLKQDEPSNSGRRAPWKARSFL